MERAENKGLAHRAAAGAARWTVTSSYLHALVLGMLATTGGAIGLAVNLVAESENPIWLPAIVLLAGMAFLGVWFEALRSFLRSSAREHDCAGCDRRA